MQSAARNSKQNVKKLNLKKKKKNIEKRKHGRDSTNLRTKGIELRQNGPNIPPPHIDLQSPVN